MSLFNAVGGVIFITLFLSVFLFLGWAFIRDSNHDTSDDNGNSCLYIVIIAFICAICALIGASS